jgi:alkylation response protein AidB-like acyl-CoA dehydrogenase
MKEGVLKGGSFLIDTLQPEDIFAPEDANTDQKLLSKVTEEFLQGEVEPRIEELEAQEEGLMVKLLKNSAKLGLQGVDIPEEFGGMGLDNISSLIVTEKISLGGPFAIASLDHTTFAILSILYFGTREQKKKYLPELAKAEKIGAFALTEPDAGSDALNPSTMVRVSEDGNCYILDGEKQFISNAQYADLFITFAKIDGEKFTAFIVERNSEGVSLGEEEDKMGIKGTSTRSLIFKNVKVPRQNLLFQPGKGHVVAFSILNIGRYKLAGLCLGTAKLALRDSIHYAKSRIQFGKPISDFGLIKEKIGEMVIRIFVVESMIYRTSGLIEEGLKGTDLTSEKAGLDLAHGLQEYAIECSINKVYATVMLDYVVNEAVQIHGGYGYIKDYRVERYYRDSRINMIYGGTNEINRLLIVRLLLRRALKGHLSLKEAMDKTLSEQSDLSVSLASQGIEVKEMAFLVGIAKKIALLSMREMYQVSSHDLEFQQEIMGMISNIIIEVFAMESSLLRSQKIRQKWGEEKSEIPIAISRVYILEGLMRVEQWSKIILASTCNGERLRKQLTILKERTEYIPVDLIALRRRIADHMLQARRYFI